jgi:alkanesulfonate monooxygenase SsuD/methylene tetrahydromethanopterin reductase-like flavin-dependent oxidoreductase (luciferase family)
MRHGLILPGGDPELQLELALLAEARGWDGVFSWETSYGVDPWGLLAAIAARSSRIRLGTVLTPLPWRRPWKVASQVATVDRLSGGRAILTVGVGIAGGDLPETGEVSDLRERADRMDEGIDLIRMLWSGGRTYEGRYYRYRAGRRDFVGESCRPAAPIPIWVVGVWPRMRSMRRVLRCDGVVPQYAEEPAPELAAQVSAWLRGHRGEAIDVVAEGQTPADDRRQAAEQVAAWAASGCTWWLENRWGDAETLPQRLAEMRERIAAGPPA